MKSPFFIKFGYQLGYIGFMRLSGILRLFHYVIYVHPRYFLRVLIVVNSSVLCLPLRLLEVLVYGQKITRTQVKHPPIFIIGHWRSGTTYLHNLMSQDSNFGYLSMYQATVPDYSLIGGTWLKALLSRIIPVKRPMDNVGWPMDGPQEEEIALGKVFTTTFYSHFLFPKKTEDLFRKYVLFEGASKKMIDDFKRYYYRLLQVATIHAKGKPLLLKNPVNTARVQILLEQFPNAKFIHIHRSPYDVFKSTQTLRKSLVPIVTLQVLDGKQSDEKILTMYAEMMQKYFDERALIPSGNLVEVGFESLEKSPLQEIQRIYERLNLPEYELSVSAFQAYIDSQKSYQKNKNEISAEARDKVSQRWRFAFLKFGYPLD